MKCSTVFHSPGNFLRAVALVAASLTGIGTPAVAQFRASQRSALPDFDSRSLAAPNSARLTERQSGQSHLSDQLPSVVVDFDPLLDAPKFIRSRKGFLTGPNGQGVAVPASTPKAAIANNSYQPIRTFLDEHHALFGHGAEVLDPARITRDYVDAHNGLHTIVWEQQLEGIAVFQSFLAGHITRNGELTSLSSRFLPDLATAADTGTPGRAAIQSVPPVGALQAILSAGSNIEAGLTAAKILPAGGPVGGYLLYRTPEQASVRQVWFPLHRSALRLAWEVLVTKSATHESFQLVIDAQTGQTLLRKNLTCHISDASYNVYDSYSPSPFGPSLQVPGSFQPPITNRNLIVTSALDTFASPDGWIPDGSNTTTGNNVDAFVDRNGDEQPDQPRPVGNPNRVFDFTLDLTQDPRSYIDASTVQLFWRGNWYHDRLYQFGFTEASGNYQDNTFGRGGIGNDHVIAFVQSGADVGQTDNSYFIPAPDGQNGRCAMFTFTGATPDRDGSLDSEIVVHEMTHGTSWRLVGGGGMVLGSLQGDGMGEGWSDFYAEALLNPTNASPDASYASGGYVTYQIVGLPFDQNYYFGIRRYPYCTDITKNPLTFKDIDPAQASAHKGVPLSPGVGVFISPEADEVHNQGEVWCITLWEMRANLVHKYGWAMGSQLAVQLATDGMKLTPALPNFLQARDAILLADTIDNNGANLNEIWKAFAKRGMGESATSPNGSTTAGVFEAYDVPIVSSVNINLERFDLFGGNGNGIIDFNECNSLNLILTNRGNLNATRVSATLSTTTPDVAIAQPLSPYFDMAGGATATNLQPFKVSTARSFIPGTPIEFLVVIKCDQGLAFARFTTATGVPGNPLQFDNFSSVVIPSPGTAISSVFVTNVSYAVNNVTVSMFVEHDFDYFLKLELIAPDGTTNVLSANNGLFGQNYGIACSPESQRTTFDDAASTAIASGSAPFIGSFKPDQPLSVFNGRSGTNVNGIWQLRAIDQGQFDIGSIHCWSLFLTPTLSTDGGGECPGTDLALGMTALPDPVIIGNNMTYDISVTNNGPSAATNVIVTLVLPDSVNLAAAYTSQGAFSQQGNVVTFTLGLMGIRAKATMSVVGIPTVPGVVSATATASSEQPDFVPANSSVSVSSHIRPLTADLALAIAAVPNPVLIGGALTYTISLANNGPSAIAPSDTNPIMVTNLLPSSVQIQSTMVSTGTVTPIGSAILWKLPAGLDMGASASATITVIPTVEGLIRATATTGDPGDEFDPNTANNTAAITITVGPASDLALGLNGPGTVVTTSNVTYTIAVTNLGPSDATGVTVNQSFSPAVTNFTWNVGPLASGAWASRTNVVATRNNGTLSTTATVFGTQTDPDPTNNTAGLTTIVAAPFVSIVGAGATLTYESGPTNGAIDIGETVTLSLRLRNDGNTNTVNLVATLLATDGVAPITGPDPLSPSNSQPYDLPSGATLGHSFSFTASGTNGQTIHPTLQLQDGIKTYDPVSFAFTLPVTQAFAPNTNAIVIPDPAAPNPSYLTGSGPAKPYPSTLNVSNFVGTLGKVTLTLSNVNHSYPPDINVLLVAPGGAKALVMSHAGDQPTVKGVNLTFDDFAPAPIPASGALATGVWQPSVYTNAFSPTPNFPTNDPGPYPKVLSALNGVNPNGAWKLYVYDDGSGDIGAISNGWSLALTSITPVNQLADLGLTAVVAPIPALAGGDLTYAFTITNNGPNSANAVAFTCTLPKGTTFKSAAPANNYILAGQTVTFTNLGSLAKGTSAFVSIVATPEGMSTTILTLTATATANETDLNPANNTVSVVTIVNQPVANLELQTVEPTNSVFAGLGFTNTVTITNHGPDTAFDVVLTNSFFSTNLSFDSDLLPQGTVIVDGTNLVSSLGALASGQGATVTIAVKPSVSFTGTNTSAILINLASVTTSSSDPNPNDSSKTNYITVVNPGPGIISAGATLNYESGPVNGAIDPDETVTLSLGLANDGALSTSNLIAILHTTGGVTTDTTNRPCILTNFYGALPSGGGSTARGFTFKATFDSSGALVATLHCQDTSLGYSTNVSFTFTNPVTTTWSSSGRITIPYFGAATPYPASINVANLEGQVVNGATVTLYHLTHSFPHDVNVLLVSPSGSNVLVMSHTGGGHGVTNLSLTFEDGAAGYLPNYDAITAGTTYRPTAYEGPVILPGNPVSMPYGSTLSALNGSSADGPWRLYVYDDFDGDSGVISGGWSLALSTAPPLTVAYEQPLPPVLSGSVSNGLFNLTVVGQPGFEYIVQGSTDLTSWVPLSTNANTTGSFIYSETNSLPFRFYRALRQ